MTVKTFIMLRITSTSNKCCSFELSIHQRILKIKYISVSTKIWSSTRAERLIAFAIISRYENKRDFSTAEAAISLHSVTWHARVGVKRSVRLEDRSYDIKVRREKAYRRRPLSYSSHSTLMTHTTIGLAALLQVKHI